jgi:hypothetical protein
MTRYQRQTMNDYRVALSNGRTLRIVAPSSQRALQRAQKWCIKVNDGTTVINVNEIVEG